MKALQDAQKRYKKRRGIRSVNQCVSVATQSRTHGTTTTSSIREVPDERDPRLYEAIQQILRTPRLEDRKPGELSVQALAKLAVEVLNGLA